MERIRTLVVDDEPLARQGIRHFLEKDPELEILGEAGDGVEALERIRADHPDLVFLDVQMPEMNGFEVLECLSPEELPLVVFVTAYDQYALNAFQVHALDYLLKPYEDERLQEAVDRAKSTLRQKNGTQSTRRLIEMLDSTKADRARVGRIMVRSGGRITFVRVEDVDWIEAQGDYICLHTQGKKHLVREKISEMEAQLSPEHFLRIHRSTMINVSRIKEMQPLFHGEYSVVLQDGTRLTMSRSFRDKVFDRLTGTQ
ncbi:MAG: response regulator transcription factor [Bacteroidetes bacterium]|nr:response regulator transcription factor [Bacteroidota bacterium]